LHSCQYETTEIDAAVDDKERLMLDLAAGRLDGCT
jgi:hypothetical protein